MLVFTKAYLSPGAPAPEEETVTVVSKGPLVCAHLSRDVEHLQVESFSCLTQRPFICEYDFEDGQDCADNLEMSSRSSITSASSNQQEQRHTQSRPQGEILHRSKRSLTPTPLNLSFLVDKVALRGIDVTLMNLVSDISKTMQDEEEKSYSALDDDLMLLFQLSEKLKDQRIRSALDVTNLTTLGYYGVNSVLQTLLSTCSENNWTVAQSQYISNFSITVLRNLEYGKMLDGSWTEPVFIMKTPMFSTQLLRENSSALGSKTLSFEGDETSACVVFPGQSALHSALKNTSSVNIEMTSYVQNPFPSDSSMNISGTVSSVSILSGTKEVQVQDLPGYFQIFLPRPAADQTPSVIKASGENMVLLTFSVPSPGNTLVIIGKANEFVALELYLWINNISTITESSPYSTTSGAYTWIIPPQLLQNTNVSCQFQLKPLNYSGTGNLTFSILSFSTQCAYWNGSARVWTSEGCKVGPQTNMTQVQCLCNHLSIFGSSFFVLPAQLDLTKTAEYFSHISDNPVIVIMLACFYACYIMSVIWVRKMDHMDKSKSRVTVLPDNDPCALYRYLVTVCTGRRRGAATNSKIFITLTGSAGQSETHHLSDPKKAAFRSGSIDVFLLTTPFPLGDLKSITLRHDASGSRKSWYVQQVTVQDLEQRQRWHFMCNTWLAECPKGISLSVSFPAADKEQLTSFRTIFMSKTKKGLQDDNIWISIISHPTRSSFTRVQRVSCCMGLLLCTVVINLMFWELPQVSYPAIISIGSFTLTWKDIMIGFESALIMFPVNLLIIYIFRNTKPRPAKSQKNLEGTTATGAKQKKLKFFWKGKAKICQPMFRPSQMGCCGNVDAILKSVKRLVQSLSKANRNQFPDLEKKLESSQDITSLLQLVKQMIQNQGNTDKIQVLTAPDQPSSEEELHVIFCGHFTYRKLRKISSELQELGPDEFPDPKEYDKTLAQLQTLLGTIEKATPPLQSLVASDSSPKRVVKVQKKPLPWWFIFVGWFLLLSMSGVSTYFTMMYGFKYGKQSSIRWIISMALSLFQSIFVLQPLKVVGFAIFFALVLKRVDEEEEPEIDAALKSWDHRDNKSEEITETVL